MRWLNGILIAFATLLLFFMFFWQGGLFRNRSEPLGELSPGQLATGSINSRRGDRWTFEGRAGERISLYMAGRGDSYLTLFAPDGTELLTSDDDGGNLASLINEYQLPVDGTYTVRAAPCCGSYGGMTIGWPYTLLLTEGTFRGSSPTQPITLGQRVVSRLDTSYTDVWMLELDSVETVSISITALNGNINPCIEVQGSQFTNACVATTHNSFVVQLRGGLDYYINVRDQNQMLGGEYELVIRSAAGQPTSTPDPYGGSGYGYWYPTPMISDGQLTATAIVLEATQTAVSSYNATVEAQTATPAP
jgi:hypothetical protein